MNAKQSPAHSNMVVQQVRPTEVLDPKVLSVMTDIPREQFVDSELSELAYADTELAIGMGQVMLKPVIEGQLLQALQLQGDEQVLEIGTGSGYFTALLAKLSAHVTSVDISPELSQLAAERLEKQSIQNVDLQVGDAAKSWSLPDRIDVIVFTGAVKEVSESYFHALKVGGRMLAVVGTEPTMAVQMITRTSEWDWQTDTLFETVIPTLINAEAKPEFEF